MADITMPQLGETVTEGTITRWAKQVGDTVAEDEVLFEVSTDKVDSEVPSPVGGVVSEILVAEGETVDVGTRLAVISAGGAAAGEAVAGEAVASEAAAAPASTAPEVLPEQVDGGPRQQAPQAETGADLTPPPPTAAPFVQAASQDATSQDATSPDALSRESSGSEALVLSPVVRRLIAEHGLEISSAMTNEASYIWYTRVKEKL